MNSQIVLRITAGVAALGAAYAVFATFTQGMLGGVSAQEIWWDRLFAWWVDFLAAGWLLMLAIYLWRRASRKASVETRSRSRSGWRVALFPLGHVLLTGCLYFADFGSYVAGQVGGQGSSSLPSTYFAIAAVLAVGAASVFWFAYRLKDTRSQIRSKAG